MLSHPHEPYKFFDWPIVSKQSRFERRSGPMNAGLGVEAFVGESEALDGAPANQVLVDDLGRVFRSDVAIPDGLRIDNDGWAVFALVKAASLVDADARAEAGGLHELLDCGMHFPLAVGVA